MLEYDFCSSKMNPKIKCAGDILFRLVHIYMFKKVMLFYVLILLFGTASISLCEFLKVNNVNSIHFMSIFNGWLFS